MTGGIAESVDFGTARLVPDPLRRSGWTLLVEEVRQSYVDLSDPTYLGFEYTRRLGSIVDVAAPADAPLRVLHLGGGALTMPRYVAATRPGSQQLVIDRDSRLMALVQRVLPPRADAGIRVHIGDARASLASLADQRYDLVIGDVYHAAQMPPSVCTAEFVTQVARVLAPAGLYAVNVADMAPLAFSRRQAATLRTVFEDVCMIVRPELLRGRRYGNVVFAAACRGGVIPVDRLATLAARDRLPCQVTYGPALRRLIAGVAPVYDDPASPP